jgi:hypothetical protein
MSLESTQNPSTDKKPSFLIRLYRGDVSLAITYWIFCALIINILLLVISIIEINHEVAIIPGLNNELVEASVGLFSLVYVPFILIAVWRSAGKHKGSKFWANIARGIVIINVIGFISGIISEIVSPDTETEQKLTLQQEIDQLNASLPSMVNDEERFDRVFIRNRDIYFDYTLVSLQANGIDMVAFHDYMFAGLLENVCDDESMRPLLEAGRNFVFSYQDQQENFMTEITITNQDCNQ